MLGEGEEPGFTSVGVVWWGFVFGSRVVHALGQGVGVGTLL